MQQIEEGVITVRSLKLFEVLNTTFYSSRAVSAVHALYLSVNNTMSSFSWTYIR